VVDYFDVNGNPRTMGDVKASATVKAAAAVPPYTVTLNADVANTDLAEDVVVWTSQTSAVESRKLRFQSLQRILTNKGNIYGYPSVVTVSGSNAPTATGAQAGNDFTGGAMLELQYNPVNSLFPLYNYDGSSAGFYPPPSDIGNGRILSSIDTLKVTPDDGRPVGTYIKRKLTQPTFLQKITVPDPLLVSKVAYLLCDAQGVYQVDDAGFVTWMFTQQDYWDLMSQRLEFAGMVEPELSRNLPLFSPNSVQKLANGDYVITNAAKSKSNLFVGGKFNGEVFQVRGKPRAGFSTIVAGSPFKFIFSAPKLIKGSPAIAVPLTPATLNSQSMGKDENGTGLLEQPLSSIRL
jgi:hypothetical protein